MKRLLSHAFSTNEAARDQALLTLSSLLSLVLNLGSSIVLSRIYDPAVFGVFAIWMSLNTLCVVPAMLRLELAVQIPKERTDALEVAGLAGLFAIGAAAIQAILILSLRSWLLHHFGESVSPFLLFSPILLLCSCWLALGAQVAIREQKLVWLAVAYISQTVVSVTLKFALMPFAKSINPLVFAELISQVVVVTILMNRLRLVQELNRQGSQLRTIVRQMKEFWQFPRDVLPASMIESFNVQLPIMFLTPAFGESSVGHFARALQLLGLPTTVLANPVSNVYQGKGALAYRETGDCRVEFKAALKRLTIMALVVFPLSALLMPWGLGVLFGPKWIRAGEIGQVLALYSFFGFICGPLSSTLFFTRKTGVNLLWICGTLACNWAALAWGISRGDFKSAVLYWASSYAVMYVIVLSLSYWAAKTPVISEEVQA